MANERSYTRKVITAFSLIDIYLIRFPDAYMTDDEGNIFSEERPCDFFGHYIGKGKSLGRSCYVESKMGAKFKLSDFRPSQVRHLTKAEKDGCLCLAAYICETTKKIYVFPWNQGRGQETPLKIVAIDVMGG